MRNKSSVINNIILYIFPILAMILALFAKETSKAARDAIYLCLDVVIPSLFPFFVLSRLIVPYLRHFSCPRFLRGMFYRFFGLPYYLLPTIVIGYLSGYPTGAKLARDMFDEGLIDSEKASRIISIANNCSPLFIIGTIGAGLFKSIRIGFILLAIHWISGLIAAFIVNRISKDKEQYADSKVLFEGRPIKSDVNKNRLSALIPVAIEDAAILSLKVTGYIVLFAVLSELLARLGVLSFLGGSIAFLIPSTIVGSGFQEMLVSVLKGVMEITSGSHAISITLNTSVISQLAAVSLICGFAGFSVHTQVMGLMKGSGARYRVFFFGKLLHGVTACILTILVLAFLPLSIETSTIQMPTAAPSTLVRILTIGLLITSLLINPYDKKPAKRRASVIK